MRRSSFCATITVIEPPFTKPFFRAVFSASASAAGKSGMSAGAGQRGRVGRPLQLRAPGVPAADVDREAGEGQQRHEHDRGHDHRVPALALGGVLPDLRRARRRPVHDCTFGSSRMTMVFSTVMPDPGKKPVWKRDSARMYTPT